MGATMLQHFAKILRRANHESLGKRRTSQKATKRADRTRADQQTQREHKSLREPRGEPQGRKANRAKQRATRATTTASAVRREEHATRAKESQPEQPTEDGRTTPHQRATRASERKNRPTRTDTRRNTFLTLIKDKNPLPLTLSRTAKKLCNTVIFTKPPFLLCHPSNPKGKDRKKNETEKTETARKNLLTSLLFGGARGKPTPTEKP